MVGENRQLVTNEPIEFDDHFIGVYKIYPDLMKENRRISICNRSDLQTLGSQPIMPKNLPDH